MRRTIAIAAVAVFFLGLLGFVVAEAFQPRMPAMASETVRLYLRSQNDGAAQPLILQRVNRASRPDLFSPSFSGASAGDSFYFGTSRSLTPFVPPDPRLSITPPATGWSGYNGSRALPFPPREVWCVVLVQEGQAIPRVGFVALHQDMYNAQWVYHEASGALADAAFRQRLATVGCDL